MHFCLHHSFNCVSNSNSHFFPVSPNEALCYEYSKTLSTIFCHKSWYQTASVNICFTISVPSDYKTETRTMTWINMSSGKQVHCFSINTHYRLNQYKKMYRLHYSKIKLNCFFQSVASECNKCLSDKGCLSHLFRYHSTLYNFLDCDFWMVLKSPLQSHPAQTQHT